MFTQIAARKPAVSVAIKISTVFTYLFLMVDAIVMFARMVLEVTEQNANAVFLFY